MAISAEARFGGCHSPGFRALLAYIPCRRSIDPGLVRHDRLIVLGVALAVVQEIAFQPAALNVLSGAF